MASNVFFVVLALVAYCQCTPVSYSEPISISEDELELITEIMNTGMLKTATPLDDIDDEYKEPKQPTDHKGKTHNKEKDYLVLFQAMVAIVVLLVCMVCVLVACLQKPNRTRPVPDIMVKCKRCGSITRSSAENRVPVIPTPRWAPPMPRPSTGGSMAMGTEQYRSLR